MQPAVPTDAMYAAALAAIVADATTLGGGVLLKYGLVAAAFSPSRSLLYADLAQPVFTGYAEKVSPAGSARVVRDQATNGGGFAVQEPTGGLTWICTAAPGTPQVIYGWYVYFATGSKLLFTQLFDNPVTIEAVNDFVEVSAVLGFIDPDMLTIGES